jgi:pantetheine-phosphate adenylyltransferase
VKQRVVYPGSFDPLTFGHLDIIERLSQKFDEVIVLISASTQKKYIFTLEDRKKMTKKVCARFKNVTVEAWDGLLVDFVKKNKIGIIAKGLRNARDFEYEITMDHTNKKLSSHIETIYLISRPEYSFISSTLVKEIASLGGDLKPFIPGEIMSALGRINKPEMS